MPILDVPVPYMVRDQLADIVEIFDTIVPQPLEVEQEIEVANTFFFSSTLSTTGPAVVDQLVGVPSGSPEDYVMSKEEVLQRFVKRRARSATAGIRLVPDPPQEEVELVKARSRFPGGCCGCRRRGKNWCSSSVSFSVIVFSFVSTFRCRRQRKAAHRRGNLCP